MTRKLSLAIAAGMLLLGSAASAETLRIGLADDPDVLDPHQSRTFVGRIVYTALCDKLIDIDPELNFVPQLATEWSWSEDGKALTMKLRQGVTFHDGEKFDAAAVKYNIERAKNLPESRRKSEVKSIQSVDVVDPMTVRLNLGAPDATLLATLSDRAGMMVSPKAAEAAGAGLGAKLVCSGPYKFVERVQQDRIVLERFKE
ncbi:MAG TPA: ABC transporter substrate-binding protein, partial [Thalassobaculum sp.]